MFHIKNTWIMWVGAWRSSANQWWIASLELHSHFHLSFIKYVWRKIAKIRFSYEPHQHIVICTEHTRVEPPPNGNVFVRIDSQWQQIHFLPWWPRGKISLKVCFFLFFSDFFPNMYAYPSDCACVCACVWVFVCLYVCRSNGLLFEDNTSNSSHISHISSNSSYGCNTTATSEKSNMDRTRMIQTAIWWMRFSGWMCAVVSSGKMFASFFCRCFFALVFYSLVSFGIFRFVSVVWVVSHFSVFHFHIPFSRLVKMVLFMLSLTHPELTISTYWILTKESVGSTGHNMLQ